MTNQPETLQHSINTDFSPYGLDMPYRIIVGNNPVGWIDPLGLVGLGATHPDEVRFFRELGEFFKGFVPTGWNDFTNQLPLVPISCNGRWKQVGRAWGGPICSCYWLCEPCNSPVIWSGNPFDLPASGGTTVWDPRAVDYDCNCADPGPATNCDDGC